MSHRSPQADGLVPDAPQFLASCVDGLDQTDHILLLLCALPYIQFLVHIQLTGGFSSVNGRTTKGSLASHDRTSGSCMKGDLQTLLNTSYS